MRKVLLGIVALMVAGELLAAAATSHAGGAEVRVGDPALARELVTGGATLIADYGAFQLLEVDPTRAAAADRGGPRRSPRRGGSRPPQHAPPEHARDEGQARAAARPPIETSPGRRLHLVQFAGPVKPEWHAPSPPPAPRS
jgi:hypothetical protein